MGETFLIDCPVCGARIEVEKRNGKIVAHWEKPKTKEGVDPFSEALKKMGKEKEKLNKYFSRARTEMDEKKKGLLDKFEKEKRRIEESGDDSKPMNPMDLD